jgi:hypothetical protein
MVSRFFGKQIWGRVRPRISELFVDGKHADKNDILLKRMVYDQAGTFLTTG